MMVMKGEKGKPDQELPQTLARHIRREINNYMQKMHNIEKAIFERSNAKKNPIYAHQQKKASLEATRITTFFFSAERNRIFTDADMSSFPFRKGERNTFIKFSLNVGRPAKLKRESSQDG